MRVGVSFATDASHARFILGTLESKLQAGQMTAFMHGVVVPYIRERTANRFKNQGDDLTGNWHPLAAETQIIRAKYGYGPSYPINVRTGQMRDYLSNSPGNTSSVGGLTSLEYPGTPASGILEQKIRTAQVGKAQPATPPRPVLGLGMTDNIFITSALAGHLTW